MKMAQARGTLSAIFIASFLVQGAAFFLIREAMWPDELQKLLLKLLAIYSVPLAVVVGSVLAQRNSGTRKVATGPMWLAIALTLTWNVLLLARSVAFAVAAHDSVSALISYLDSVAEGSSFLIAGVLAFFFERAAQGEKSAN